MPESATVGALNVELSLDSAKFDTGIKKSQAKLRSLDFSKGVKSGLRDLQSGFEDTASRAGTVGNALSAMGVAGIAAGAALGIVAVSMAKARDSFAFADDIADTANKLDVSTKSLQEYRFAVHALGGDYTDADAALEGFTRAFGSAQAKLSAKAIKPFKALGLDPAQFHSTEEALDAVVDRISKLSSTAQQAAIADKLGLTPMLPAIRAGATAIDDARAAAERLGFVMDDALVQKGGEANDRMEDLQQVLSVQLNSALVDLAPVILSVAGAFTSLAHGAAEAISKAKEFADWSAKHGAPLGEIAGNVVGSFVGNPLLGSQLAARSRKGPAKPGAAPAPKPETPRTGTTVDTSGDAERAAHQAAQRAAASLDAIAAAARDELSARTALVDDVARQAELQKQAVDLDTKDQARRLQEDAAQGRITQAAAATAMALTEKAASEKKALIARQAQEKIEQQQLAQQRTIAEFNDQVASLAADAATSTEARNRIEAAALAARQQMDARALKTDLEQQQARGEISEAYKNQALAAQRELHAAQTAAQEREARARLEAEANARAESALEMQIDLLSAQADLAKSSAGRRLVEIEILKLQQKLERLKLQEILNSSTSTDAEREIARAKLALLDKLQGAQMQALVGDTLASFQDAQSAIEGFANAFKGHDWAGALRGLDDIISSAKIAFGPNGSIGSKIGAAAGIANAAGQMIGGGAGSALSGAAGGAMAGFQVGGPVGAAIGGIIGGLGGLLGHSKAKKAAKKQAAAQKAAEEAQRKADIAAQKRDLELQLIEAQGKSEEALAARRADELAAMDESNRELQKQIWAAQDAAEAIAKAAEKAASARDLEIQLLEATGHSAEATAAKRAEELAALDESLRPLQQAVWAAEDLAQAQADAAQAEADAADAVSSARDQLSDAYDREASSLKDTIDRFRGFSGTLREFAQSIGLTDGSTGASAVAAEFRRVSALAKLGNEDALGKLQDVSSQYLDVSKGQAKTLVDYLRTQAQVKVAVTEAADTADRQADLAERQLDALNAQVEGLVNIGDSLLTVGDAITQLAQAVASQEAAQAKLAAVSAQSATPGWMQYGIDNPDVAAAYASGYFQQFGITTAEDAYKWHYEHFGKAEGRQGFATGGSFTVGGFGGTDSQLMQFRATPGEMVDITRPGQAANHADEIRALRSDVNAIGVALAKNSALSLALLKRWDGGGLPDTRDVA